MADRVACGLTQGELWACGREFQNSIDESVHRTLSEEIQRLGLPNFDIKKTEICHSSGGRSFYVGLSRNILSLKGVLSGIRGLWIEEGEGLSEETINIGFPSVRMTIAEREAALKAGEVVTPPEIWITMNRRSREDPISKLYLARAEADLEKCGYYEDDEIMVVEANYTDMPKQWFLDSGLEPQRASDQIRLPRKVYANKWLGKYIETVDNPLIHEEWFDACIDAHLKLGFKAVGEEVVAHDPSDLGPDSKGLCYRHGSIIKDVLEKEDGDIFEGCDWAVAYAVDARADIFVFDGDGVGGPLRERIDKALSGKKIVWQMYRGSEGVANPDDIYQDSLHQKDPDPKTNKQMFNNMRTQRYVELRDRMFRTWEAVNGHAYHNPEDMISFCSEIKLINKLRAELCRLPLKPTINGKMQLLSKQEMAGAKYRIPSPNLADSVKMSLNKPAKSNKYKPVSYATW